VEIRLRFTIAEHGRLPENGERVLDAFMEVAPESGPSVSQNTVSGALTITFAFDASDARDALDKAKDLFARGIDESGLDVTDVLDIEASVVPATEDEETGERELQPA